MSDQMPPTDEELDDLFDEPFDVVLDENDEPIRYEGLEDSMGGGE